MASADALITEHGVAGVSVDEVLSVAGASKSQMYHYFSDRQDLVHAVVARRCDFQLAEIGASLERIDSIQGLEALLKAQVAAYRRTGYAGGCPIGSLASELADRDEAARGLLCRAFDTWERHFTAAFERMRARGELRADASPSKLAMAFLASLEGGQLLSQTRKSGAPLRAALGASLAYLRTFAVSP